LSGGAGLAWLPLLFAVWANMHGGWIVGVGVVGLWIVGRVLDTRSLRAQVSAIVALAAGVLATLVNPYGWRLWAFLLTTVRMSRRDITEWRPLWEQFDIHHGMFWQVTVAILATTAIARWRKLTWATTLPVVWLGVNGLLVARLTPLFGEASILCLAEAWRSTEPAESLAVAHVARPRFRSLKAINPRVIIDAIVILAVSIPALIGETRCLAIEGDWIPDRKAAGAFEAPDVRGRLVLPFNWGEYAIWHWGPRLRVSMDGRRETVYSEATVNQQTPLFRGQLEGIAFLKQAHAEYVWVPTSAGGQIAQWLTDNGYRIDVKTGESFIAVRQDMQSLVPGSSMPACFP
jgi:hypothetical protein